MTFPTVNGSNLQRAKLTLPQDFEGDYNLLFIAFQQWQQDEVNTWIALAENCEARFPGPGLLRTAHHSRFEWYLKVFHQRGHAGGHSQPKITRAHHYALPGKG